jgi:hypothetical protein
MTLQKGFAPHHAHTSTVTLLGAFVTGSRYFPALHRVSPARLADGSLYS